MDPDRDLAGLTAAIAAAPGDIRPRLLRAALHAGQGSNEEAKADYLAALALDPTDFAALNDLGALLSRTGYRSAARLAYAEAARHHPAKIIGRINLGNALLAEGLAGEARAEFEAALELDSSHPDAHQGMANLLQAMGEDEGAERHRQASYARRQIVRLPYRGEGSPCRVLVLVSAAGGNLSARFLDERLFEVSILVAEAFTPETVLPPHDVVFNTIGDADLAAAGLKAALKVQEATAAPVINPPAQVLPTGREEIAARLRGLEDVIAPRMVRAPRADLAQVADAIGYPLLVRSPGFHTGQNFVRVEAQTDLSAAASGLPGEHLLLIEPLAARGADGWFAKYRVMAIGGALYPAHLAFSRDWKVHYFSAAMQSEPELRAREAAFLEDMPGVLGERAVAALEHIREALGLDYAGVDFALAPDGRLSLFEANPAMTINPPGPEPLWDYRRPAIDRILAAARDLTLGRWGGP